MEHIYSFQLEYKIKFFEEEDIFLSYSNCLKTFLTEEKPRKVLFVVDEKLCKINPEFNALLCTKITDLALEFQIEKEPLLFPGDEFEKTIDSSLELAHFFESVNLCRHSLIIAIGGGAFLDTVGFAASLTHRGIRLARVPTTTLAQCDSGVGVKNGVNAFEKKNFLGAFQPPVAVFNDPYFLSTLPEKIYRDGIAEMLKVAMIKDVDFYHDLIASDELLKQRDVPTLKRLISRSAHLHIEHIITGGDPFENGSARPLDFGHWVAHKLEAMSHYTLSHGAAVAIGLVIDAHQAFQRHFITQAELNEMVDFLQEMGFNLKHPLLKEKKTLLKGLEEFREHLGGELQVTFPKPIGCTQQINSLYPDQIEKAFQFIQSL